MKQRYFRFLIFFVAILIAGGFFVYFSHQARAAINTGIEFAAQTGLSGQDIRVTIAKIIRIILGFLGVLAVGIIIYAGFIWMTSKGNEEKLEQAKMILRNGAIGLIIVLASFAIATFILRLLQGATGGGGGGNGNGGNNGGGIGSLGNGIVKSVYPEPYQKDVPRNTSIIVTFREAVDASTICNEIVNNKCGPNAKIKSSVRLYKTSDGDDQAKNVTDVKVTSTDNKIFIFKPIAPLGSPSENIDYTTKLTRDIKKANGSDAFKLSDFYWSFEVNNKLDLVPPKIKSITEGGIFPLPDNEADVISGTEEAQKANGAIEVAGIPTTYRPASASLQRTSIPIDPIKASISGVNSCSDGYINISILSKGTNASVGYYDPSGTLKPGLTPNPATINIINNKVEMTPCGLTLSLVTPFASGDSWRVNILSEKISDTMTIGSKTYAFVSSANPGPDEIRVGSSVNLTAQNIAAKIGEIHPEVAIKSINNALVTVEAKIAGEAGNSIEMSSTPGDQTAIRLSGMRGGKDKETIYTIKDNPDQPKNTVIQINFSEGVNPLMVNGTSEEVKDRIRVVNATTGAKLGGQACTKDSDCRSYKCNVTCQGDQLAGNFIISNQYKTLEFVSDVKCGVNGCGENIYCLPANSNLMVETKAASLKSCTSNAECNDVSPYNTCTQGVCYNSTEKKNYPSAPTLNGVVDLADNSLDGNRNNNAQGQVSVWNENNASNFEPPIGNWPGDNYSMSFWISDRLDLTPPLISGLNVTNNQSSVNKDDPIQIIFNKLMMSSSLSTGTITVNNGTKDIVHKLINLWSLANDPIGYWATKEDLDFNPLDGKPDRTKAYLSHGKLNDSTYYDTQVGSGVKDIYQNCYKPSNGPGCTATASQPSCCRNAQGVLVPTANLTPDGNCP